MRKIGRRQWRTRNLGLFITALVILTAICAGADQTNDESRLVVIKRGRSGGNFKRPPTNRKQSSQQLLTHSFLVYKTPDDAIVENVKEVEKSQADTVDTNYLPTVQQSAPVVFAPGLVLPVEEQLSLDYLPPQSPSVPTTEKKSTIFFPPPARNPELDTANISLFDVTERSAFEQKKEKSFSVLSNGPSSLFDDNVIPPAGVIQRIVVNNSKTKQEAQQKFYTIQSKISNEPRPPSPPIYDRLDDSLFDLESGYQDNLAVQSPALPSTSYGWPATTKRPQSPSLFDAVSNSDDSKYPVVASAANFEPSPPSIPLQLNPPAAPPAYIGSPSPPAPPFAPPLSSPPGDPGPVASPTLYAQSEGDYNQVHLTWAQLHASLTPSTDTAGIISSITNSGNNYAIGGGGLVHHLLPLEFDLLLLLSVLRVQVGSVQRSVQRLGQH